MTYWVPSNNLVPSKWGFRSQLMAFFSCLDSPARHPESCFSYHFFTPSVLKDLGKYPEEGGTFTAVRDPPLKGFRVAGYCFRKASESTVLGTTLKPHPNNSVGMKAGRKIPDSASAEEISFLAHLLLEHAKIAHVAPLECSPSANGSVSLHGRTCWSQQHCIGFLLLPADSY